MLMRGRKPKPTLMKELDGNPGKRAVNDREPVPPDGVPDCPEHLDEEARAEWFRTAAALKEMGLLSQADRSALAAYCVAYSRWVAAEAQVKKFGTIVKSPAQGFPMKSPYLTVADQAMEAMRKFMVEFGLTPSSRSRIRVPLDHGRQDEFDRFLQTGCGPMLYLASPYSHPNPSVREARFQAACEAAAALVRAGRIVFAPIVHSHPIAQHGLPTDWSYWERGDRRFLEVSDEVVVLTLPGWRESRGVQAEIQIAGELRKPVTYLAPPRGSLAQFAAVARR